MARAGPWSPVRLAGLAALLLSLALATPTLADNTVSVSVISKGRTAAVADYKMAPFAYSHMEQTKSGLMLMTVDDMTGSNAGWNVMVQASDFVYSGTANGSAIPAANFSLVSLSAPTRLAGQPIASAGGPQVPAASSLGTLDTARKVLRADPKFDRGIVLPVARHLPDRSGRERNRHLHQHAHGHGQRRAVALRETAGQSRNWTGPWYV